MSTATIPFASHDELRTLFGTRDVYLRRLREAVGVNVMLKGDDLVIEGESDQVRLGCEVVEELRSIISSTGQLLQEQVDRVLGYTAPSSDVASAHASIDLFEKAKHVEPRTPGQSGYVAAMRENDLVFCRGPAGCGKTDLAVAMAVNALRQDSVH